MQNPNAEMLDRFGSPDRAASRRPDNVVSAYSKDVFDTGEASHLFSPARSEWNEGSSPVDSVQSMFRGFEDSPTHMAFQSAWDSDHWNGNPSVLSAQHVMDQCDMSGGGGCGGGYGGGYGNYFGGGCGGIMTGSGCGSIAAGGGGEGTAGNSSSALDRTEAASVQVIANDGGGNESLGSGFFVSKNGLLTTDDHVVKGAEGPIQIDTSNGETLEAEPVVEDQANDVAILKIVGEGSDQDFPTLQLGGTNQITSTDYAVGHPEGDPNLVVNSGNFEGFAPFNSFDVQDNDVNDNPNRLLEEFENMYTQPGSSGSPIINSNGVVVGMDDLGDGGGDADATLASAIAGDLRIAEEEVG